MYVKPFQRSSIKTPKIQNDCAPFTCLGASPVYPICKIMIVVIDGVSLTTMSSLVDPFCYANKILACNKFELQLVSLLKHHPITTSRVKIECQVPSEKVLSHADLKNRPDLVILACGQDIDTPSEKPLLAFLRKIASASVPFLALGAANAYAASMELIAKDKCVAHWETIGLLRENFPAVEFSNVLFETSGQVTSCAGELASLDFVVNFIESHCGSTIAQKICGHFLIESRRTGQAVQLLNASAMLCADQRIQNAVAMMIEHIEQPISIHEISTALSISTRQLERIFARYGFGSPCKYFKTLRLERARQLLEQSNLSVSEVALACGFECQTHFSKNYKKRYGVSPRGFRNPLGTQSRL